MGLDAHTKTDNLYLTWCTKNSSKMHFKKKFSSCSIYKGKVSQCLSNKKWWQVLMAGTEIAVCHLREHLEKSLSLWNCCCFPWIYLDLRKGPGKLSHFFIVVERQRISAVEIRKCHAPNISDFMFKAVLGFHL